MNCQILFFFLRKIKKYFNMSSAEKFTQSAVQIVSNGDWPWWLSWMRCPTGDQKVAGSTSPRSATFFRGD